MSTFKFNQGTMSNEELEKRSKFWSEKQFRTRDKKEIDEFIEQLESSGNFKCEKGDSLSLEDFERRNRFWNKKQFRTWNKKELERTSTDMQKLLAALREFSTDEIKAIRKLNGYSLRVYHRDDPKYVIWSANQRDLDYAISIAPKTFKVKQG